MTFTFTRTFTKIDVEVFGNITRDYNPVNYERQFALVKGFSGLICHGLLIGSKIYELGDRSRGSLREWSSGSCALSISAKRLLAG